MGQPTSVKTIVCSSMAGHEVMAREYPEQIKWLYELIAFSRQGEGAYDKRRRGLARRRIGVAQPS